MGSATFAYTQNVPHAISPKVHYEETIRLAFCSYYAILLKYICLYQVHPEVQLLCTKAPHYQYHMWEQTISQVGNFLDA